MTPGSILLAAAFAPVVLRIDETPAPPLAFVHVEANVDGASGGHTALRIGDDVYHFQQSEAGTLRLNREGWPGFRLVYAGLQNRSLHLAYLDAARTDVERVADRLSLAWVEQERDLARLRRSADDAAWWEAGRAGLPPPPLRGAGLLDPETRDDRAGRVLREALGAARGTEFAASALERVERRLADLAAAPGTDLEPFREALLEREALLAIVEARGLDPAAVLVEDPLPLSARERSTLESFRASLERSVLALLESPRSDRGFPLLVSIARHHAARRSLDEGRLILLGGFADDAPRAAPQDEADRVAQARLAARAHAAFRAAREAVLADASFEESRLSLLEEIASRAAEARLGARGEAVRVEPGRMVPRRGRVVGGAPRASDLECRAAEARGIARRCAERFAERHAYSLVERNCVTELVRLVNAAFPDEPSIRRALGSRLEPGAGLEFVPFVFHDAVSSRLRIASTETIPSQRLRERARVAREDPGLLATLRESTTLTSTIYAPRPRDGAFLFFTDDRSWSRPLLGLANLGYGLAYAAVGAISAPIDGGRRARAGAHGAFFSLPEIAFANVRKGSFACDDGR